MRQIIRDFTQYGNRSITVRISNANHLHILEYDFDGKNVWRNKYQLVDSSNLYIKKEA